MGMAGTADIRIRTGVLRRIAAAWRRHGVTSLANTVLAGKITLSASALIQYQPAVGIELYAAGVVHITAHEPYVWNAAIAHIDMTGMAVGTLDVLVIVIVGLFTGMTVGTDIDRIGCATPQIGTKQEAIRSREPAESG